MPSCGLNTNTNTILNTTHLINHSSRYKEEFVDLGLIEEGGNQSFSHSFNNLSFS